MPFFALSRATRTTRSRFSYRFVILIVREAVCGHGIVAIIVSICDKNLTYKSYFFLNDS